MTYDSFDVINLTLKFILSSYTQKTPQITQRLEVCEILILGFLLKMYPISSFEQLCTQELFNRIFLWP